MHVKTCSASFCRGTPRWHTSKWECSLAVAKLCIRKWDKDSRLTCTHSNLILNWDCAVRRKLSVNIPTSMGTSRVLRSRAILRPWQFLQRSRGLIRSPCPWHSWHIDWICWMKPGSSCWMWTCVPEPPQPRHSSTAPSLPPRPNNRQPLSYTIFI